MRSLLCAPLAVSLWLGGAIPAAASCAPPVSVAENAARATAVVHGTVTSAGGGAITVRVDRVYKGDVRTPLQVSVGPDRGGASSPVATSVDYAATVGSDHVLYLLRGSTGSLETNACVGSHPGAPSGEEVVFFGPGTVPAEESDVTMPVVLAALAIAAVVALVLARRRSTRGGSAGPD